MARGRRRFRVPPAPSGISPRAGGRAAGSSGRRVPGAHETLRGGRARIARGARPRRFAEPPRGEITLVLGLGTAAPSSGDEEAARAAVAELVEAGATRRTAAEVVSRLSGTSRNRALSRLSVTRQSHSRCLPSGPAVPSRNVRSTDNDSMDTQVLRESRCRRLLGTRLRLVRLGLGMAGRRRRSYAASP